MNHEMELGKQIKKYRLELKLSQEELAEKIFVTRQTISNWENAKNYPDINSLVLLSSFFQISLDTLVKGDLDKMKEQIKTEDIKNFNDDGKIFFILFIVMVVSNIPLWLFLKGVGIVIWLLLVSVTMYYAFKVEKQKKNHNIQAYKEIIAFTEGKKLDEIEIARESGKRIYQKVFLMICSGLLALMIGLGMAGLFSIIGIF